MAEEKAFLEFGEREAQILAARDVGKLSTMQKQRLAENGLISPLVFMLQTQDYESVEAALFALLNLAFGSERNKLRIAQSGAIPAILKILQWRNESLLELALAALLILSSCSGNKPEIASSGAVQLLIQLLASEFPLAKASAIRPSLISYPRYTTSQLRHRSSIDPSFRWLNLSNTTHSRVREIIRHSREGNGVARINHFFLRHCRKSVNLFKRQVSEMGGATRVLVEAVEDGTGPCKEHAVGILVQICRSCRDRYRGMILREGQCQGSSCLALTDHVRLERRQKLCFFCLEIAPMVDRRGLSSRREFCLKRL
ncbi:hypothetical protein Sango_1765800 [Sesamum angolense]|uniref:Uncharacterized protein n=1 Tax=Sesamum angolense TaxID=2727404 RepID=A0AAE1WGM0_9LAMI|nr:hypothetical protein Sango_1765800 [Sesamum angolense]